MAEAVYILCATTSMLCAVLLLRGYLASRTRLLFWSALCFVSLALNNLFLVLDLLVFPSVDLSLARAGTALVGMMLMLIGLVWENP